MRVFKYQLEVTDRQTVIMPKAARILCVQAQNGRPCLWALVPDDMAPELRVIFTHGTGHTCSSDIGSYVGTYQLQNGAFVGHVFEETHRYDDV
mgnify:CR=1 FL=1